MMTDSHNIVFTPGNPTQVQFDTNVIRKLQTPLRMQVNGATGACAGMNFNGYAVDQLSDDHRHPDGDQQRLRLARHRDPALQLAQLFEWRSRECLAGRIVQQRRHGECRLDGRLVPADNSVYGGPDAGGSSIVATSGDPVQWWNSVTSNYADPNCGGCNTAFQHALRTTLGNQMISARVIPPGIAVRGRRTSADDAGQLHADQSDSVQIELQPGHQRTRRLRVADALALGGAGLQLSHRLHRTHRRVVDPERQCRSHQQLLRDGCDRQLSLHHSGRRPHASAPARGTATNTPCSTGRRTARASA